MRLDKYISECTQYGRREAKRLASAGGIRVNGVQVFSSDFKVAETDRVELHGTLLCYRKFIYLMLNKPQGVLSATEDRRDPVVTQLVPLEFAHFDVFPVGRLDKDTEGLLILSNDGAFAHDMTSPKKDVFKRYFAVLDSPAGPDDAKAFAAGMDLGDFTAKPAKLELTQNPCEVFVEISEGKFHQVKRMCEKIGKNVVFLKRVAIGALKLDPALPSGKMRELSDSELALLGYSVPKENP